MSQEVVLLVVLSGTDSGGTTETQGFKETGKLKHQETNRLIHEEDYTEYIGGIWLMVSSFPVHPMDWWSLQDRSTLNSKQGLSHKNAAAMLSVSPDQPGWIQCFASNTDVFVHFEFYHNADFFFMSCYLIPTASSFDPVILSPRERERKSWKAEVKLSPKLILNKGSNVYSSIKHTLFSDTKASNGNEKFLRPPAASKNKVLHAVNTVSLLSNADTRLSHSWVHLLSPFITC